MASDEVMAAIGEAPARSEAVEQLAEKRAQLIAAETALADAEQALDTDRTIAARQRVDVLRGFITRLETAANVELQTLGERRARALQRKYINHVAALALKVAAAQDAIRAKRNELVELIRGEANLRAEAEQLERGDYVLSTRFGFPRGVTRDSLPELRDWIADDLLDVVDSMRPSRRDSRRMTLSYIASMTPAQRRQVDISAAVKFATECTKELPAEVRSIMAETPVPPDAPAAAKDDGAVIGTGNALAAGGRVPLGTL